MLSLARRFLSSNSTQIEPKELASRLFKSLCTQLPPGAMAVDPRGMKFSQLKRHLRTIKYSDDLPALEPHHANIVAEWQTLYDEMVNDSIALPGREKAGPLTFHKVNDAENVRDLYDKHGRVQH